MGGAYVGVVVGSDVTLCLGTVGGGTGPLEDDGTLDEALGGMVGGGPISSISLLSTAVTF